MGRLGVISYHQLGACCVGGCVGLYADLLHGRKEYTCSDALCPLFCSTAGPARKSASSVTPPPSPPPARLPCCNALLHILPKCLAVQEE